MYRWMSLIKEIWKHVDRHGGGDIRILKKRSLNAFEFLLIIIYTKRTKWCNGCGDFLLKVISSEIWNADWK